MLESALNQGVVTAVRGSVVDAYFPAHIPHMFSVLTAGQDSQAVIEVISHLSSDTVRGIALTSTRGLERGG